MSTAGQLDELTTCYREESSNPELEGRMILEFAIGEEPRDYETQYLGVIEGKCLMVVPVGYLLVSHPESINRANAEIRESHIPHRPCML